MGFFKAFDVNCSKKDKEIFTCLVSGFDNAANNTDVLFVFSYNSKTNEGSVIQIPRDTYCSFGETYGRINSIFPKLLSSGLEASESMELFTGKIEEYLGIKLDGYIGLPLDKFREFIDLLGGVYIDIPQGFQINGIPLNLKYGKNLLSGNEAEIFIRHRSSYINGDIGRIDAQKIFLEGLFNTILERLDAGKILKMLTSSDKRVYAELPTLELVPIIVGNFQKLKSAQLTFLTMPGEAKDISGIWYYILNKKASEHAIRKFTFNEELNFDEGNNFTNENISDLHSIYSKEDFSYTVYSNSKSSKIKP
jgi:LCP family protein required for cell wall assembly